MFKNISSSHSNLAYEFPNINVEKISRSLQIKIKGGAEGEKNRPHPEARNLDSNEQEVVSAIRTKREEGIKIFQQCQKVYQERISRSHDSQDKINNEGNNIFNSAKNELQASASQWNFNAQQARNKLDRANQSLDEFIKRSELSREPMDGSGFHKFLGIASMILVVESIMNGYFFSTGHEQGLLGGFFVAVSISVLNVGFASLFGWVATYKNHIQQSTKLLGWLAILLGSGLIATLNLATAHFRDKTTEIGDIGNAARKALEQFLESPFGIMSFESWVLAGLGSLIAIVAAWKAYHIDDPYPGYGSECRRCKRAHDDLEEIHDNAHKNLNEIEEKTNEKLGSACEESTDWVNEELDVSSELKRLQEQFQAFLDGCNQNVNHLLTIYRNANLARRGEPSPAYFTETYVFTPPESPNAPISPREEIEKKKARIKKIHVQLRNQLGNAAQSARERIKPIDE